MCQLTMKFHSGKCVIRRFNYCVSTPEALAHTQMGQPTARLDHMQPVAPGLQDCVAVTVLITVGNSSTMLFVCLSISEHMKGAVDNVLG